MPLYQGAYEKFLNALRARPKTIVQPIPVDQLKVASLGKARLEKGYPSTKKLIDAGVPTGLACSLADFQRGGVDFVIDKGGRGLIADGKFTRHDAEAVMFCFFTIDLISLALYIYLCRHGIRENNTRDRVYDCFPRRLAFTSSDAIQCAVSLGS